MSSAEFGQLVAGLCELSGDRHAMLQRPLVACAAIDQYWPRLRGADLRQCMQISKERVFALNSCRCALLLLFVLDVVHRVNSGLFGTRVLFCGLAVDDSSTWSSNLTHRQTCGRAVQEIFQDSTVDENNSGYE